MGKPKSKGPKSAGSDIRPDIPTEIVSAPRPKSPLKAADGHNVDGWADEDIRTYNELLTEREKLEKEKNELEQKSSRHQTQRALLDENATALDSLFKTQMGGEFKFTGPGKCCLDFDAPCGIGAGKADFPCKHELCTRAKTKGVSWMELDTIKYYNTRILSEKSQRMQSALRKQRDVELVRVKKDDDEEAALRARRNAILDKATRNNQTPTPSPKADKGSKSETSALDMLPLASKDFLLDPKNSAILEAAKENEHIVRRIRGRLDKIRHDVNAGRVSPADARVKLDQANSEMAEAERKNNEFRQMILDAEPALSQLHHPVAPSRTSTAIPTNLTTVLQNTLASSNADAFSQALSVMKGFFSASDPHDVQTAITDLRSVLELNGPMSPVLQKSFRALEDMLAKPNAKGFTVDVTTSDGKTRTCSNVVEVMMNLRLKIQGSDNPSTAVDPDLNLDEDTIKANLECIKVEDAAKKDMVKIADRMTEDTVESVTTALKKIKAKAILKSPIPPLSDIVLDDVITDILFRRSVKALVVEATAGASLAQLSGKLTSLIITSARNKPEKYLATLKSAKECIDKTGKPPPQVLLEALSKVETSMPKFVAAHEEKLRISAAATKPTLPASAIPPIILGLNTSKAMIETRYILEGILFDPVELQGLANFLHTSSSKDGTKLRARIYEYYHRNLEEGIWEMLRVVLTNETSDKFSWADFDDEKVACVENLQLITAAPEPKLTDTVAHFLELGLCPGRAAIIIGQRMALQIRENFEVAKEKTLELKSLHTEFETGNKDWLRTFNFIAQTMTDTFGTLTFCLVGKDAVNVPIMAADIVGFICTFVLGSMDAAKAEANLQYIEKFVLHTLLHIDSRSDNFKRLRDVFFRFHLMCQDSSRFRCAPDHTCQEKFCAFAKAKVASLFPGPLNVKKEKLRPEDDPSSPSFQTSTGLPREAHLQLIVASYWDVAKSLTPHLKCIALHKNCGCSELDKEFGEEIQVLKNSIDLGFVQIGALFAQGKIPPKSLWDTLERSALLLHERPASWPGNQKRLTELRKKVGTSRFEALFPPQLEIAGPAASLPALPKADTSTTATSRRISLKQVPVNLPNIQNNMSSSTSEKGKLEKHAAETSANQKIDKPGMAEDMIDTTLTAQEKQPQTTDTNPLSQARSEATSEDENPFPMTDREVVIRDQLLKFADSVDATHAAKDATDDLPVNKAAFDGVAWQLEEMLIGHVEMAHMIAKAQGYDGLKAWIEYYFKNTMPTPLGDGAGGDEDAN